MKRAALALSVSFWLFAPRESEAWFYLDSFIEVNASMTRVAESTYDFNYDVRWLSLIPPARWPGGIDPLTGYVYVYYPDQAPWSPWTTMEGDFGLVADLSGGESAQANGYYAVSGMSGSFRMTQAPQGVFVLNANQDIAVEVYTPQLEFAGRDLVGSLRGAATLYGDIPTSIGQTSQWAVTPEPATWALVGICLMPWLVKGVRRRHLRQIH